jgi:hypothetical protein
VTILPNEHSTTILARDSLYLNTSSCLPCNWARGNGLIRISVRGKAISPWKTKGALIVEPGNYFSSGIFIFPDVSVRRRGQL